MKQAVSDARRTDGTMLRARTMIMLTFHYMTKSCVTPWAADALHRPPPQQHKDNLSVMLTRRSLTPPPTIVVITMTRPPRRSG
jgi:hypothetical protein